MLESTSHYTNSNWLLGDKRVKGDTAAVELIIKIDPNHNHNQRCFYIYPGNGDVASNEIKRRLIALSATRNLLTLLVVVVIKMTKKNTMMMTVMLVLMLLDGRTTLPLKSESANLHRAECMGTDFNVCESLLLSSSRSVCKPIFRTPNLSSFGLR